MKKKSSSISKHSGRNARKNRRSARRSKVMRINRNKRKNGSSVRSSKSSGLLKKVAAFFSSNTREMLEFLERILPPRSPRWLVALFLLLIFGILALDLILRHDFLRLIVDLAKEIIDVFKA